MSLKSNRHTLSIWAETVNTVSLLVTLCDIVATVIFVSFAVLPKCSSCPGVSPQRCFARSVHTRGLGKIIFYSAGHSVLTDFWATKKAGTSRWYVPTENSQTSPLFRRRVITSKCNRLWKSKTGLFIRFPPANSTEALTEAAIFSLSISQTLSDF